MGKFKIKETYLLLLIVLGLVSLGIYTTYAMFTSSVEIGDISLDTTLQYTFKINSNEQFTIGSNSRIRFNAIVENDMSDTISYGVYYKMINPSTKEDNLIISEVTDSETLKTSGPIESGLDKKITIPLVIINNTSSEVTVEIGVRTGFYNDNNKPENIIYQTGEYLIDTKVSTSEVSNETCEATGSGDCTEECTTKKENGYIYKYCMCLQEKEKYTNLDTSGANTPDLVDGLIPVMYDGSKWVKADSKNENSTYQWYDYDNKLWANAILVTDTNRTTYQNASAGTTITESDILAYYVWIPRYKYKVWNKNKVIGTNSYNSYYTQIDVVFENEKESTGTISCTYSYAEPSSSANSPNETCTGSNGDYYTHPAFTFGSDKLRGFWMGKFEISSSNPSANYGGAYSTTLTVRILPNVTSWRYNTISNFFTVIQNMQTSSNIYGLSTSRANTDSHMITNMEWGAVAYLTHSKYGRGVNGSSTEVSINGYGDTGYGTTTTGCGPISSGSTSYSTTCNAYNTTLGMSASTTNNITGIYDMSGGALELVMSNVSSATGNYVFKTDVSGFSSDWYTTSTAKYVTIYATGNELYNNYNNQTAYNRSRLGDATGEVVLSTGGWYDDAIQLNRYEAWLMRGGEFSRGSNAGIFATIGTTSGGGGHCTMGICRYSIGSTRAILASLK